MEKLVINIPENQEIDWQESAKQKKIVFKDKGFGPKSWEEYCHTRLDSKETRFGYTIGGNCEIYPADWDDSCSCSTWRNVLPTKELADASLAMMQLISLRQAWIGDWKPNWAMHNSKYVILFVEDILTVTDVYCNSRPLSFPTKEMADEFIECFRNLIYQARILL